MKAAGKLSQVFQDVGEALAHAGQLLVGVVQVGGKHRLRYSDGERQRYEPLLNSVMEIALEAPARLVARGDDARS